MSAKEDTSYVCKEMWINRTKHLIKHRIGTLQVYTELMQINIQLFLVTNVQ